MILLFSDWVLSKPQGGLLGYQYDNLTRELVVQGDLPEGWTWDMLVSASGNSDTWPLALGDGQASITLTDDNLSVRGEYYLQLRGTNGDQVRHTNVIAAYNSRSLSGAGQWPTLPTEWIQAEKDIKELNAHPPVPGSNGYWLLWDLSSHSYQESDLPVPVGPAGPPNVLEIGTVETLPADQPATASITGESPAQKLNLGIPQGKQDATGNPGAPGKDGQNGVTPTLAAGNVETLEPGQPATASVTGEGPEYQINLGIPQGKTGETGAQGVQGEIGPRGYTFTPAVDDAGNLSWTNDGGLPNPEEVNIKGPIGATGPQGNPGATPAITVGTVTTLDPGQDATAEITGKTPNLTLNLGIPEGQPGQDGVQLNDSAVNTTEAWSSKKIVDTLCPAFSVSGNPVTCHPVEGYPLSAVVTLKPKQAGSGDPRPDNVRPISGYDSVTVTQSKDEAQVKQITLTLPKTIYGGTVDAVTGVGSAQYIYKELAISDMDNSENYPGWKNMSWINEVKHKPAPDGGFATLGIYGVTNIADISQGAFWNSNGTQIYSTLDQWGGKTQSQIKETYPDLVVQFCLQLVTPTPFQATGNQALPAVHPAKHAGTNPKSQSLHSRRRHTMNVKPMIESTILSGDYELDKILSSIDLYHIEGSLTDEERRELIDLARENAKIQYKEEDISQLLDRLHALEERVTKLEGTEVVEKYPEYEDDRWYFSGEGVTFDGTKYTCIAKKTKFSPAEKPKDWQEVK